MPVEEEKCESGFDCGNDGTEAHTCPYAEEINDDYETSCNCCEDCAGECADNI